MCTEACTLHCTVYLCKPEQSIHSNIPRLILAHLGLSEEQSAHLSLPSTSRKSKPLDNLNRNTKASTLGMDRKPPTRLTKPPTHLIEPHTPVIRPPTHSITQIYVMHRHADPCTAVVTRLMTYLQDECSID